MIHQQEATCCSQEMITGYVCTVSEGVALMPPAELERTQQLCNRELSLGCHTASPGPCVQRHNDLAGLGLKQLKG